MADQTQKLRYELEIAKTGTGGAQAAKELQEVSKASEASGKSLGAMGREFKTAMAAVAGAAIIRESIQAFTEQDAAVRRLNGTLIALGRNGADTSRQLQALAQSVILPPGASRNSVLDAITELTRQGATTNELPRLTQMVMDLAAAGLGVERAADAMGNAVAGDFGKLAKILNVDFPAAAGRANNLAEALGLVQQRFGGLAASTAGGLGGGLAEFNENLTKIKESLGQIILTGLEPIVRELSSAAKFWAELVNGKTPAPYERPAGSPGGPLRPAAAALPSANANYDPALAARQMAEQARALQVEAANNAIRLGTLNGGGQVSGIGVAQGQRDVMLGLLDEQLAKGLIKQLEHTEARKQIDHDYYMTRAQLAAQAVDLEQQMLGGLYGAEQARVVEVQRQYAEAAQVIEARYQFEIEAGGEIEEVLGRQEQALQRLAQASKLAQFAGTDLGRELQQVGQQGVQAFAGGISNAMVQAFRTGKLEFRAFAADFLAQIAQMIMQALVLATIKRALGGTKFGSFLGLANGGFAPRLMAAGGVQTVSTATYFPRFNAVAGEAGSEVLAVLSKPRFMQIGGLQSYVGSVAGSELAMTNARDLRSAVSGQRSAIGGEIVVVVRGTKDFEARVVDSSIEGALVRVHNEVLTDTGLRSAIKEVGA